MSMFAFSAQQSTSPIHCLRPLELGDTGGASARPRASSLPIDLSERVTGPEMARKLIEAGWEDEARALLHQLLIIMPEADEPWLQLLSLEPSLGDDREFLEAFMRNHPDHRFTRSIGARLEKMRVMTLLGGVQALHGGISRSTTAIPRLGEHLIAHGWTSWQHVEFALTEQQRLREMQVDQRLGTTLLMHHHVTTSQLASALVPTVRAPTPQLGNFLVRNGILRAGEVAETLAYQSELGAEADRRFLEAMAGRSTLTTHGKLLSRLAPKRRTPPRIGQLLVSNGLLAEERLMDILREHAYNTRRQTGR